MNQQPDKLFRDTLSDLSRPVPSAAWDRIQQGMQPTVHRGFPWKIAASILLPLVAGAAVYLYWQNDAASGPVANQGNTPASAPHVQPTPRAATADTTTDATDNIAPATVPAPAPAQRNNYTAHKATTAPTGRGAAPAHAKGITTAPHQHNEGIAAHPTPATAPAQTEAPFIATTQTSALTNSFLPATTGTPAKTEAVAQERSMTLVFHANETEAYLDKNSLAEATEDDKDASTFKKLIQKARDLKNNQDPIGDLRLKKNEILALNFKNEKRGQNK